MDTVAILIAASAFLGSIPVFYVAWLHRDGTLVKVGRRAFWAMGLGLVTIGTFYISIALVGGTPQLVIASRIIWYFIIVSSVGMAGGVLAYMRQTRLANGRCREENG